MDTTESLHGEILPNATVPVDSPREPIGNGRFWRRINPDSRIQNQNPMKQTVTEYQFIDSFRACGRESQFSVPARRALFEHFEIIEQYQDEEIELDPIGICCEFAEYPCALEAAKAYGFKDGIDSKEESPLEWLQNRTQVIEFDGGIVIQQF
jgi:hypothetical protein